MPQNPPIDEFYEAQKRRLADFEAQQLRNVRSGSQAHPPKKRVEYLLKAAQRAVEAVWQRKDRYR